MNRHLHIVMHDVPWPVNFGGVTDLFCKLVALHEAGVKIHLHCFTKKRPPQSELEKYCETVSYYPRKVFSRSMFRLPFIVSSRSSAKLINNLNADMNPVLFEGIHCTYPAFSGKIKNDKRCFLRLHNVEHKYYESLGGNEPKFWKGVFFRREARLLKNYEKKIARAMPVFAVNGEDADFYRNQFYAEAEFLPVFLPWEKVRGSAVFGKYCLYHGNLSVNENERAALWLIENVFANLQIPLIIAGLSPSSSLLLASEKFEHINVISSPTEEKMDELIGNAQINILPSFNNTGVKIKLLHALYLGRHCIVNPAGAEGSGVENVCRIESSALGFKTAVKELFEKSFDEGQRAARSEKLTTLYDNKKNAAHLIASIWKHCPAPDRLPS